MSSDGNSKGPPSSQGWQSIPQSSQVIVPSAPGPRAFLEAEFEKNYPKNIFIPLIEYLTELGYKQSYEKCVGCRSEVQGKNVVSLGSIFVLITQDWFVRNINKQEALGHISNKILLNSKIKKKLFHLLIAHLIFTQYFLDVKDFKRRVSRQANIIAKKHFSSDEIFAYPNAIIYLLHLFLKILLHHASKKGGKYNKLEQEFSKLSLEESSVPEVTNKKGGGSKQEYKFYVKQIVHVFGGKGIGSQNYAQLLEQVKQTILEKDKLFRQKYKLVEGIPNWIHFVECVVNRCFQYKKKDHKLTNFLFNQWINECKNKMLSIGKGELQNEPEKKIDNMQWMNSNLQLQGDWGALPLPLMPSQPEPGGPSNSGEQGLKTTAIVKQFSPIILSSKLEE